MKQNKEQFATRLNPKTIEILSKSKSLFGLSKAVFIENAVEYYKKKLIRKLKKED